MQEEIYNNILIMLIGEGIDITANIKERLWIILSKYDYGKKVTDLVLTDEDQNNEYIKKFLIAKTVTGCAKRTIEFYGITLRKAIPRINKNVVDITTEDIRFYLATRQRLCDRVPWCARNGHDAPFKNERGNDHLEQQ